MTTIRDVAKKANVSPATVSRVLRKDSGFSVSEETKIKIKRIAEEMGYQLPSYSKKKKVIAMVLLYSEQEELVDRYYQKIRVCGKEELESAGYLVEEIYAESIEDSVNKLSEYKGIILVGYETLWFECKKFRKKVIELNLPVVASDFKLYDKDIEVDCVTISFKQLMLTTFDYFNSLNYKPIGYVGSSGIVSRNKIIQDNRLFWYERIQKENDSYNKDYIYLGEKNNVETGYELGLKIASMNSKPRALFVETDPMAMGVVKAFNEAGIRIPDDVALISCNDDIVAQYVTPSLTTVHIYNDLIGKMSAKLLMDIIETDRKRGIHVSVPIELIIRETC